MTTKKTQRKAERIVAFNQLACTARYLWHDVRARHHLNKGKRYAWWAHKLAHVSWRSGLLLADRAHRCADKVSKHLTKRDQAGIQLEMWRRTEQLLKTETHQVVQ